MAIEVIEHEGGHFIRVNRKEAIQLIHSLSSQLMRNNPNYDRLESYTNDGNYFSIAVKMEGVE